MNNNNFLDILKKVFDNDEFCTNVYYNYAHNFGLLNDNEKDIIKCTCQEVMRAIINNWDEKYYIENNLDKDNKKPKRLRPHAPEPGNNIPYKRYWKCNKCGAIGYTTSKLIKDPPNDICTVPMSVRTSGICGGSYSIEVSEDEYDKYINTILEKNKTTEGGEFGVKVLKEVLEKFKNMSTEEYNKLYEESLTRSNDPLGRDIIDEQDKINEILDLFITAALVD